MSEKRLKTAFVGWRGMVGSVLLERMRAEGDLDLLDLSLFSTSQAGVEGPFGIIEDASLLDRLAEFDVVISCQGGGYTQATYGSLRATGWNGYWVDAASTLRMKSESVIVLDPVNGESIDRALASGGRCFIGGNCTVSLLLMAIAPWLRRGWVEWVNTMTYQAVSGAGAAALEELARQNEAVAEATSGRCGLDAAAQSTRVQRQAVPEALSAPIASNLVPWIDAEVEPGVSREEWKGFAEASKILDLDRPVAVDGLCVRVPVQRCHAQALSMKLREPLSLDQLHGALNGWHEWLDLVPNEPTASVERLTPLAVAETLRIAVGRLRPLRQSDRHWTLFTVGDQLLWGAAEPLRRLVRRLARGEW